MSKKALTNSLKRLEYFYSDNRAVFSKSELQEIQDDIDDIKLAIDGKPSKKEYFLNHTIILFLLLKIQSLLMLYEKECKRFLKLLLLLEK